MKFIKHYGLFIILLACSNNLCSQRVSWYFPEYKFYLRPTGNCNRTIRQSIWGSQFLKIKVYDSCRRVEISCYRSKDSTLKERGVYYTTGDTVLQNATVRQAGTDSARTEQTQHIIFGRIGTWKFYSKAGRVIRTVNYKKED